MERGIKKGKEYDNICSYDRNINPIYEGEFANGERHGKGVVYYYNKNDQLHLSFEVEYLNGESESLKGKVNGKEYYLGRLIYEGEFLNGKKHGKVMHFKKNGKIYFEEYLNGKKVK